MRNDTVNPMPASAPTPVRRRHVSASGRVAQPSFDDNPAPARIPSGLPTTSPKKTPIATGSATAERSPSAVIVTPAAATAKTGAMTKLDQGWKRCRRCSAVE